MKRFLLLAAVLLAFVSIHAADDPRLASVRAADDERVAATLKADPKRLTASFSDELRYAHSSGVVDTKTSYIDTLVSGRTKYTLINYEERNFTFPAPGMALMSGRAHIKATTATGEMDSVLAYLAVWREEKGKWRFLAWQSCKLTPPAPATK